MQVEKEAFARLIEYYKMLPMQTKRNELINELEDIISNYTKLCTKLNVLPNMALNKEMLNINREDLTEEEFLPALFAYVNTIQAISGQFIDRISDLIENKN